MWVHGGREGLRTRQTIRIAASIIRSDCSFDLCGHVPFLPVRSMRVYFCVPGAHAGVLRRVAQHLLACKEV